jgi:stalled ribosome alternative rescue factor ArfA
MNKHKGKGGYKRKNQEYQQQADHNEGNDGKSKREDISYI